MHRQGGAATFDADLPEALADQGFVGGAGHDLGVEEIAMPNFDTELLVVVLAELSTVILALHEDVAFHLVGQMQCCSAGSELLEDNQVDAVGIYLEGNW